MFQIFIMTQDAKGREQEHIIQIKLVIYWVHVLLILKHIYN